MLARTKDIGAGGFRARPTDGALAATGGPHPRPGGTAPGPYRWSPGSAAQHQGAPTASGPGAVCGSRGATRTGSAGAARRARHCPKAIRAHGACRRPGTTPSQLIPAAGDADRDHIGDAVEAQARPGADSRCRAAAVRCRSNVPASSIASVCSVPAQQSRLVGAVLAEQHDEWAEPRRHLAVDVLGKSRSDQHPPSEQQAHPAALTA